MVLGLKAGEDVEVRSAAEILATLDENGTLDGLPFMPEMLRYCGQRLRVSKRADKTCDTISGEYRIRRMHDTVHLEGARCDGTGHAGCQAICLLFWKEAWLARPVNRAAANAFDPDRPRLEALLARGAVRGEATSEATLYRCQATELLGATDPMSKWDLRQYVRDVGSRNVGLAELLRGLAILAFNMVQRRLGGHLYPHVQGTGSERECPALGLRPGEWVRVKGKQEILDTLDVKSLNRGLSFDVEMVRFCGKTFRVLARAERIIDEKTGRLLRLRKDSIILEGAVCSGTVSSGRPFCPRALYPFWREAWLERVEKPSGK